MFTSDVCWGSLGTSIFGNSSSAANNTRSRLPSRLSFRFLWLWTYQLTGFNKMATLVLNRLTRLFNWMCCFFVKFYIVASFLFLRLLLTDKRQISQLIRIAYMIFGNLDRRRIWQFCHFPNHPLQTLPNASFKNLISLD